MLLLYREQEESVLIAIMCYLNIGPHICVDLVASLGLFKA